MPVAPRGASTPGYAALALFIFPLLFTTQFMSLSHAFINGFLARMDEQATVIAAYGLGMSAYLFIGSLSYANPQITAALVRGRASLVQVLRYALCLGLVVVGLDAWLIWSGTAHWLFADVFGAKPQVAEAAVEVLLGVLPLSLFTSFRGVFNGLLSLERRTYVLSLGVILRILCLIAILPLLMWVLNGAIVGSLGVCLSIAAETLFLAFHARHALGRCLAEGADRAMGRWRFMRFVAPLVFAMNVQHCNTLMLNAVVSRLSTGPEGLAVFTLIRGFIFFFYGPFMNIQQAVITLGEEPLVRRRIQRFTAFLFALFSAILLCIQFMVPDVALAGWMGLEDELIRDLRWPVLCSLLYGGASAAGHLRKGERTRRRTTGSIGYATLAKFGMVAVCGALIVLVQPPIHAALAGVILLGAAESLEYLVLMCITKSQGVIHGATQTESAGAGSPYEYGSARRRGAGN